MMIYRKLARPVLFRIGRGDPEAAHETTMRWLSRLSRTRQVRNALIRLNRLSAPTTVFGIRFPNPIGLAAGLDKNGVAIGAWPALGFGFAEVGTVTAQPQPGNPRPRLYRLTASEGLVNRMGFNNEGAGVLAARLAVSPPVNCPIGVSIGKSKAVPLEEAVDDYLYSLRALYNFADYFAVNVSSPNTPGLRQLQDAGALAELLAALKAESESLAAGRPLRPILVKIAPDLTEPAIAQLLEVCLDNGVAGVIATNTTLGRDGVKPADEAVAGQPGGMSGRPLGPISREVVRFIHRETAGKLPIIGSGGIMTADDAQAMFDAGASLVQIYSGLIYSGPAVVRQAVRRYRRASRETAPQRAPRRPQPGPMAQPRPTHAPPAGPPMAPMPPGGVSPGMVPPNTVPPSPHSQPPAAPSPAYQPTPPGAAPPSPQSAPPAGPSPVYQPTPPGSAMPSVPPAGPPIASPTTGPPLTAAHPAPPSEPLSPPPVPPTPPHTAPQGPVHGAPGGVASDPPPTTSRS